MPLSHRQLTYLALAWQCFDAEPKIDYDKFHTLAGLASAHSARELLRVTKKKLSAEYGALGASLQAPAGTGGKRSARTAGLDNDGNGTPDVTPSKRAPSCRTKGRVVDYAALNGGGDDDVHVDVDASPAAARGVKIKSEYGAVRAAAPEGEGEEGDALAPTPGSGDFDGEAEAEAEAEGGAEFDWDI